MIRHRNVYSAKCMWTTHKDNLILLHLVVILVSVVELLVLQLSSEPVLDVIPS